jgi:hypothetical protein
LPKATDIRGPQVTQKSGETVQEKEAQKQLQNQVKKKAHQDAARVAQRAGFQRLGARKRGVLDIGDSSQAPIPLPGDELMDTEDWNWDSLDKAQEQLVMSASRLDEVVTGSAQDDLAAVAAKASFMPTEEGVEKLQGLVDKPEAQVSSLDGVSQSAKNLFNIQLDDDVPLGHRVLAMGLIVAGEAENLDVVKGKIKEHTIAGGVQKVAQRSNQSIGEAQKMSKGINRELNVQRTVIFKR